MADVLDMTQKDLIWHMKRYDRQWQDETKAIKRAQRKG